MSRLPEFTMWVIYDHPSDDPDHFVARKWRLDRPTLEYLRAPTLEAVRALLPLGLVCLARIPHDDPKIIEMWL